MNRNHPLPRGKLFILSGPAGCGKNTLAERLLCEYSSIQESISCTTRKRRPLEKESHHYHFLSRDEFEQGIARGDFLEYVELFGNLYGTPRLWIEKKLAASENVLLIVDVIGAQKVRSQIDSLSIFIAPPNLAVLEERMRKRQSEDEAMILERVERAKEELNHIEEYDFLVVNDDLDSCYERFKAIFLAEFSRQELQRYVMEKMRPL